MTAKIAIILPGTTGTSLVGWGALRTHSVVLPMWPDQVGADLKLGWINKAEALITQAGASSATSAPTNDSTIVPYQPSTTGYSTLATALQGALGKGTPYVVWNLGLTKLSGSGNAVIGFGYDWRLTNTFSAQCLQSLLKTIDTAWGAGNYEVVLVAHSMGGLVARAYLENVGTNDSCLGAIKALITFGTPHLGAPLALDAALGNQIVPSLNPAFIEDLIDNVNFPSTYQLLPPPQVSFVTGAQGTLYSGALNALAIQDGASQTNLAEAANFFSTLNYDANASGVPYYAIWGVCNLATKLNADGDTLTSFTQSGTQLSPVWTSASGDGVVPSPSAQFQNFPVAATYQALYADAKAKSHGVVSVDHFQLVSSPDALDQMSSWINTVFTAA